MLIDLAKQKGVSAYIGDGSNSWPAVHVADVGELYRMVVEDDSKQSNFHGVAEEGVALRDIAERIGAGLGLPVEPRNRDHFGWFADFAEAHMPASSAQTRQRLGWKPTGPTLLEDLEQGHYFG
jgi:nucleoside-diphosphate-sugar epimerase